MTGTGFSSAGPAGGGVLGPVGRARTPDAGYGSLLLLEAAVADAADKRPSLCTAFPPIPGSIHDNPQEWLWRLSLFPVVPSEDRLLSWPPGLGLTMNLTTSTGIILSDSKYLHLSVLKTLKAGLEPSTRQNYGSSIAIFLRFCFDLGLSARDIFPISEGLLVAWVSSCVGSKALGTVRNYLSALKSWHLSWGQDWPVYGLVTQALKGVAKLAPARAPLRPPIEPVDLVAVRAFLQPSTSPLHAAVWACALFSFFCVCRLSETTTPSQQFFDPARHVTRANAGAVRRIGSTEAIEVELPWTKTTHTAGITKVVSRGAGMLDPLQALEWHLLLNKTRTTVDEQTPLFSYKVRAGRGWRLVPLTKSVFLTTFADALKAAGRPSFTGHSFRIGGASVDLCCCYAGRPLTAMLLLCGAASLCCC
ncbi:hypothetical protein V8E36_002823 [Tilletia maclaganii]